MGTNHLRTTYYEQMVYQLKEKSYLVNFCIAYKALDSMGMFKKAKDSLRFVDDEECLLGYHTWLYTTTSNANHIKR